MMKLVAFLSLLLAAGVMGGSQAQATCARWDLPKVAGYLVLVNGCEHKVTTQVVSGGGPQNGRAERYFHLDRGEVRQIRALALGDTAIIDETEGWDRKKGDDGLQYLETRIQLIGETDVCMARNTHPKRYLIAHIDVENGYSEPALGPWKDERIFPYFPRRAHEPCVGGWALLDPE